MTDEVVDLPAFPSERHGVACLGMTLRDYFAAAVIGHLVCAPVRQENTSEQDASFAYRIADLMLKARQS